MTYLRIIGIITILTSSTVYAENLRELCRQRIAGQFLNIWDQAHIAELNLKFLESKMKEQKLEILKTQTRLKEAKEKNKKEKFDPELEELISSINDRMNLIKNAYEQNKESIISVRKKMLTFRGQAAQIRKKINLVFKFTKIIGKGTGYKFRLDYHYKCNKYQAACALPRRYREPLVSISGENFTLPDSCKKYSTFLIRKEK